MINLKLSKSLFVPKFFPLLFDYSHRWEVYMGSAGSAKSYFITQKLIIRACSEKIRILVCRKTGRTNRESTFALFRSILMSWKLLPDYATVRESLMTITFANGSEIIFTGLDEETKLLSIHDIGCVFIEEAFEVPQAIVEQLNLRLRGKTENKQIIMAFNPISKRSWLYNFCEVNPPKNFKYIHSTYKDNPFLDKEVVAAMEEDYIRNPAKARIYNDGQWGVDPEGLVITNWKKEEFNPIELAKIYEHRCGLDLGWMDPSAIVDTLYDKQNHKIYIFNEFYKSGQQLSDLVKAIEAMSLKKSKIRVDSAEPRSIQYLRNNGINAEPASKGPDSVKAGLMFLQDNQLIVHPKCEHFLIELENFSYIKSKVTGEYTEDTTHEWSHAIDACRYAYSDIYTNKQLKTFDKSLLGL